MRTLARTALASASVVALSAFGGAPGLIANAQPPTETAQPTPADGETVEADVAESSDEAAADAGGNSGGGATPDAHDGHGGAGGGGGGSPAATTPPGIAVPGSSRDGGGGDGGNGRPTQDPDKGKD